MVHAGLLVITAGAGTAYALAGPTGRVGVYTAVVALPVVMFLAAMITGHLADRLPWGLATAGLVVLLAIQLRWPDWIAGPHLGQAEGSAADIALWGAHGLFLAGVSLALRRRATSDPGGIIDAALFGLCAGGPLWVWVVHPQLPPGASALGQVMLLADLLIMGAVVAGLIRIGLLGKPGRATIGYLVLTSALTMGATMIAALAPGSLASALVMLTAYLTMAAGAIHPGAPEITRPLPVVEESSGRYRLSWMAAALSVNPAIAAVQTIRSEGSANLLLPIGTLLVIPLVVARIRQLTVQRDAAEKTLAYHATHDELTGLFNRRHVSSEIDRALAGGTSESLTVLLCDLDRFKPINDEYGHPAGDEVLRVVAHRLSGTVRDGDVVGRLGGDEFVVLCPGLTEAEAAELKTRIAATVGEPITVPGGRVDVGVTIGAAHSTPASPVTRETLIGLADMAMYAGKPSRRAQAALAAVRP
jgi:diguanylate cyclase (GGDEF)-like protein